MSLGTAQAAAAPEKATALRPRGRRRWIICGLLFAAIVLSYVDRQVLSVLKPYLQHAYGSLENAFRHSRARYLFVSYRSDWRYPPAEVDRMRAALESLGADARHVVLESPLGHGAFLFDVPGCDTVVRSFLGEPLCRPGETGVTTLEPGVRPQNYEAPAPELPVVHV